MRRKANSRAKRIGGRKAAKVRSPKYRAPRPASLSPSQLKKRADVFAAHSDMLRNRNLTASQAAKDRGITVPDFWTYAPKAFKKDSSSRIRAVADRYVRRMEVPGP